MSFLYPYQPLALLASPVSLSLYKAYKDGLKTSLKTLNAYNYETRVARANLRPDLDSPNLFFPIDLFSSPIDLLSWSTICLFF